MLCHVFSKHRNAGTFLWRPLSRSQTRAPGDGARLMSYRPAPRPQPDASPSPRAPPLSTQWWAGCAGGAAPAKGDPDSPPPSSRSCKRRCGGWSLLSPSLVGSVREDGKRSDRRHRPESRPSSGGCGPPPHPFAAPASCPSPAFLDPSLSFSSGVTAPPAGQQTQPLALQQPT